MQTASKEGMQTLNQDLTHLVKREIISREEALNRSSNQEQLIKFLDYAIEDQ